MRRLVRAAGLPCRTVSALKVLALSCRYLRSRHVVVFSLRVILLFGLTLSGFAKPKEEPLPAPPTTLADRVQVFVGEPTTITLRIRGRVEEPVEFLVRKKPRRGTLGAIRPTGPKTAEVLYTPGADARPDGDFFTFAAQSVDSPVSAAARVDIEILHRPARLEYSTRLEFGTVPLGDSRSSELQISNTGGQACPLNLRVNPPWRFADPLPGSLAAGAEIVIPLLFEPTVSGDFSERLTLSAEHSAYVVLIGSGTEAFSWPVQGVEISSMDRESDHHVSIPFTNRTATSRTLEFEWPENILAPREIEVPSGQTLPLPIAVRREAPPTFSFRGNVGFRSGNFTDAFPLTVHPAHARLSLDPAEILDLGQGAVEDSLSGNFTISNAGGLPAGVRLVAPKELSLRPDPSSVLVSPGASAVFEVSLRLRESGDFSYPLDVFSGNLALGRLNVRASARAALPVERLLNLPPPPNGAPTPAAPSHGPLVQLYLRESTRHSVSLEWPVVEGMRDFFFERAIVRPGGVRDWERWDRVGIRVEGEKATAHFRKLPPGTFWHIRLRSLDEAGVLNPPPPGFFRIETRPLDPLIPFWIWFPALLVLAGAAMAILLKKRLRVGPRQGDLDERIAKLEKK
jgi:hypothetical protein